MLPLRLCHDCNVAIFGVGFVIGIRDLRLVNVGPAIEDKKDKGDTSDFCP